MKYYPVIVLFFFASYVTGVGKAVGQSMSMDDMPGMSHNTSKVKRPVTQLSNEATKKQLILASNEGKAVDKCTAWINAQNAGMAGTLKAGEYKITWALSRPEGWYVYNHQHISWQKPENANAHIYLFIQDGADSRIVPPLNVTVQLTDAKGIVVLNKNLPFAWMPLVNGYGDNLNIPESGNYKLQLEIDPPAYHRHDPYNGDRFTEITKAEIPVKIDLNELSARKPLSELMESRQDLSADVGKAYANTLKNMYKQANDGRDTTIGDFKIAYAVEYAEGYWDYEHGVFRYKVENDLSGLTNAHIEVAILDAKTGRFMHNLNVTATLSKDGKDLGTKTEPFMWHPWLYHYGENWRVPSTGKYQINIKFDAPAYRRYGKIYGQQFVKGQSLTFNNVKIKTGQK